MKRFRFRLETLMDHRKRKEEEQLRKFVDAQENFRKIEAYKGQLQSDLHQSLVRREGSQGVEPALVKTEESFVQGTKKRIEQTDHALEHAARKIQGTMRRYLQAKRDTEALSRLREKQLKEYKRERRKKENKELDEYYSVKRNPLGDEV